MVKVRNGEATAVNIKEGFDSKEGVSARAQGFALMIDKFVDKVGDHLACGMVLFTSRVAAAGPGFPYKCNGGRARPCALGA